jgi:colicin import membrane protein
MQEIMNIQKETALSVFTTEKGLDPILHKIKEEVSCIVTDASTKKGRDEITSIAYKITRSKTTIDDLGKSLTEEWAKKKQVVDSERKRAREFLDVLKEEFRKPLTEWEQKEADRVAGIRVLIEKIHALAYFSVYDGSAILKDKKIKLEEMPVTLEEFQEMFTEATIAKTEGINALESAIITAEQREHDQQELIRLREEAAKRAQQERDERIRQEAIQKAKIDAEKEAIAIKEAAEKREALLKRDLERAEQAIIDAEKRAELLAKQQADRDEALKKEQEKIERSKKAEAKHRLAVLETIAEQFVFALSEIQENKITANHLRILVEYIANDKISNLKIIY